LQGDALVPEIVQRLAASTPTARHRPARALALGLAFGGVAVAAVVLIARRAPHDGARVAPDLAFSVGAPEKAGRLGDDLRGEAEAATEARFSDGSRVRIGPRGRA